MTFRLTKIDELTIGQHYHLDASDTCFFGEYTARKGFGFSETNQLIHNLKNQLRNAGPMNIAIKGKLSIRLHRCL